jgi:hypothetical protein
MKKEIRKRVVVEEKEIDHMKVLENGYIDNLLEDLHSHIRVVGGVGLTEDTAKLGIEELSRHLFPNGIELRIHNRRLVPDPLKED